MLHPFLATLAVVDVALAKVLLSNFGYQKEPKINYIYSTFFGTPKEGSTLSSPGAILPCSNVHAQLRFPELKYPSATFLLRRILILFRRTLILIQ